MTTDMPIAENEILGAVVPVLMLSDLREILEEEREHSRTRTRLLEAEVAVLKAFGDLFTELVDETERRKWIRKIIQKAEREVARTRLDLWFWRPEIGLEVGEQLRKRARYLVCHHLSVDDAWDLLGEFLSDYAKIEVPDSELKSILEEAHNNARTR